MKNGKDNSELVTKSYLDQTLGKNFANFKDEFDTFRSETARKFEFVFNKFMEHDERFNRMDVKLDNTISIIQGMADKVTKSYEIFMAESASIHYNYKHLEARTAKLEEVVFPRP